MQQQARQADHSLRHFYYTVFRHKRLVVATFLLVSAAAVYLSVTTPKVYQAEARILVGVGREFVGLDPTLTEQPRLPVFQSRDYEINQEIAELQSPAQLGSVVDTLSPRYLLGATDQLPAAARALLASRPIQTQTVAHGAGAADGSANPGAAAGSTNAGAPAGSTNPGAAAGPTDPGAAAGSTNAGATRKLPSLSTLRKWVKDQLVRLNLLEPKSLREQALARFQQNFEVKSEYNSDVLYLTYRDNSPARAYAVLTAAIALYMLQHVAHETTNQSYAFFQGETARLRKALEATEGQLQDLRQRYGIVSIDEQKTELLKRIGALQDAQDAVETDIAASTATVKVMKQNQDPNLYKEQARLKALDARRKALVGQLAGLTDQMGLLNRLEFQVKDLKRQAQTQEQNLNKYLNNLELARINRALEKQKITNITVLQDSVPSSTAVSPNTRRNIILGLLVGLLAGIGLAFAREQLDHTLKTPQDVEGAMAVPSAIAIPIVNTRTIAAITRKSLTGKMRRVVKPQELSGNVAAWFEILPDTRESFMHLRDDLYPLLDSSPFVLAVTSYGRAEGVSTVAAGLAYAIAGFDGEKVLLVDANLHQPGVDRFMGARRPAGLHEMSIGGALPAAAEEDTRRRQEDLPGDYFPQFEPSRKIESLLPTVQKNNYRVILLDLPSTSEGSAAFKSASRANGTLLVVQSEKVRREVVMRIRERIERLGGRVLGIVLNRRRYYIPDLLYR